MIARLDLGVGMVFTGLSLTAASLIGTVLVERDPHLRIRTVGALPLLLGITQVVMVIVGPIVVVRSGWSLLAGQG